MRDVVIVGGARTPIGSFQGELRADPGAQAGRGRHQGGAGARRRLRRTRWARSTWAACCRRVRARRRRGRPSIARRHPAVGRRGHRQQGLRLGAEGGRVRRATRIAAGEHDVVVAGGMESMSNAPYLLPKAREGLPPGARAGDRFDDPRRPVGRLRQRPHGRLRRAVRARRRASRARTRTRSRPNPTGARCAAQAEGKFRAEIVPVEVAAAQGPARTSSPTTRSPGAATSRSWRRCGPAFQKDGTITAGNASSINDGAAALVLAAADVAAARGLEAAGAHRRLGGARAGARVVHHRAGGRDRAAARARSAGRRTTSICGRSTRRSRSCRSRTTGCWGSTRRG